MQAVDYCLAQRVPQSRQQLAISTCQYHDGQVSFNRFAGLRQHSVEKWNGAGAHVIPNMLGAV